MNNPRPYLISLASQTNGVDTYIKTLSRYCLDSADIISVEFTPFLNEKAPHAKRLLLPMKFPGSVERFKHIPFGSLDLERFVIFTDTDDVVFQGKIPALEYDKNVQILIAPQGTSFEGDPEMHAAIIELESIDEAAEPVNPYAPREGKKSLMRQALEVLRKAPLINDGIFAMRGKKLLEFTKFLEENAELFKGHPKSGQMLFNLFIGEQPKGSVQEHPTLMIAIRSNLEMKKCKKSNGRVFSPEGEAYSIVHYNGSKKSYE